MLFSKLKMIRSTAVVLMDPFFSHLSIPTTSVLYKVEGTQYKICCVSKHDYRCAAVKSAPVNLTAQSGE